MDDVLYPNFRKEVIDVISEGSALWLHSFPVRVKGKRKDDLVVFSLGQQQRPCDISLYENPRNLEFDEGIQDESVLVRWNKLTLQMLKQPSSCMSVDISGNGFRDLIVTCEYGESLDAMDPYGGRICWLENFGTNEGDWSCREIGRFPGVNCVKVGHFSTTYSLQLLAVVKSSRTDCYSPLIVFTRPPDVYASRHWLVATALENVFSAIQDCLVVESAGGALNNIIISSREGLTLVWYHGRSWHHKPLCCVGLNIAPGKICAGRVRRDPIAYIVSAEANGGAILSVYNKEAVCGRRCEFRDIVWTQFIIDDFSDGHDASILDVLCVDLNGDGMDEVVVSVSSTGPSAGIYCFFWKGYSFVKYKLSDEAATKITPGHFASRNKLDLAILTRFNPCKAAVLYHSFVSSQIKPSIEDSELIFSVPRVASSTCEIDVIDIAGYTISLIVLPPDASFNVATDGSEAVKVLHGLLGWIDSQSKLIERTCAACLPGCVTPMLVDSPEGHVRSGSDGAVFVRMRPSHATDAANLRALNVLPSYFPSDVCAFEFVWLRPEKQWYSRNADDAGLDDLFHLSGFRIRFNDKAPRKMDIIKDTDASYVHFWAAAPGTSTGFVKNAASPWTPGNGSDQGQGYAQKASVCSIRASLSNPSGEGGLVYCQDPFDWGSTPPTPSQIARAQKMVLPVMYEHGPFWRLLKSEGEDIESVVVEYPWHSWVAGRTGQKGHMKWHIWATLDFPTFEQIYSPQCDDDHTCAIC